MHAIPAAGQPALSGASELSSLIGETDYHASLWRSLIRRRWTALRIFFTFVALVAVGTLLWPKQYQTSIKVIAGNASDPSAANANADLPVLNALLIANATQSSETYAELFKETPVAQRVIDDLKLSTSPTQLLGHVTVAPITNTNILTISATWSNPTTSANIANAFGSAVVERQRELVASQANAALTSLKAQIPAAQARMSDAQNRLASFEAAHQLVNIDAQTQSLVGALAALDTKIGSVQADRTQMQAQLAAANAQLGSVGATVTGSATIAENPVVTQLKSQLAQVMVQLDAAEQQYTDRHPTVIALKAQKARLEQTIAGQPQSVIANRSAIPNPLYQQLEAQAATDRDTIAADTAQIAELIRQRGDMNKQLAALPGLTASLADLQRDATSSQAVFNALQQKLVNAQVASETALSDVTVTQPASPSEASVRPSLTINLLVAIVLGALLGVSGALLLEYLDTTIRDARETEEELRLPQLGTIPAIELREGEPALPWVKSLALESFLTLVTNIKYASAVPLRSLVVLSPSQGDGKSMIALNVALALAELEGSVALVDCDLRRPSLHAKLRLENERGLTDVLVGRSDLDGVIVRGVRGSLDVLTSGTPTPNPLKLLESARFEAVLHDLESRYATVVLDGAALVGNVDSAAVARRVSATVLVLSQGTTDLRAAREMMGRLGRLGVRNVLGFVTNRVEPKAADYASDYMAFLRGDALPPHGDDAPIVTSPG
ncbi:MAG: polysaccharide biosynthesis tyrosine autokinase [bacterium]|nr:polysaccharide biosynthesis tyrosine autokinase [bacterium]